MTARGTEPVDFDAMQKDDLAAYRTKHDVVVPGWGNLTIDGMRSALRERVNGPGAAITTEATTEPKETTMKAHEYAELFPETGEAELAELAADIREHGQLEAIETYGGTVLDGRSRLRACEMAGTIPETREFEGTDAEALAFVVSRNLHRRHLSTRQRAAVAVELANMRQGQRTDLISNEIKSTSQAEAAKTMGVSVASVRRAAQTRREDPEAHEAAKAGEPKPRTKPGVPTTAEKSWQEDVRLRAKAELAFKALDRRGEGRVLRPPYRFKAEQVHFVIGLLMRFHHAMLTDTELRPLIDELLAKAQDLARVLEIVRAESRGSAGPADAADAAPGEPGTTGPGDAAGSKPEKKAKRAPSPGQKKARPKLAKPKKTGRTTPLAKNVRERKR